jgi:bifunctional non-homologous end joining protein LigD
MGSDVLCDITLTNLDQPLFDDAGATKRDLVAYLDAMHPQLLRVLKDRALSVIRARPGQTPFMQKNLPKGAPDWLDSTTQWAESSQRNVTYALCNDRRSLVWFANQRAVEYHPTLVCVESLNTPTHLVVDLDPPESGGFAKVVAVARLVQHALSELGLNGVVKTSGAKGLHIFVPLATETTGEHATLAVRALAVRVERLDRSIATTAFIKDQRAGKVFVDSTRAGGATVVAAYSPRIRPGVPVSFPIAWGDLDAVAPRDFTIHNVADVLRDADPWRDLMPTGQILPHDLIDEGRDVPIPRAAAMHEGKRRKRAARSDPQPPVD